MTNFTSQVYALVTRVPRGRVVSYGGVAAMLDRPRAARAVGQALSRLSDEADVPWWRVVDAHGRITRRTASPEAALQRSLLEDEGVRFRRGRIDWHRFGWIGEDGISVVKRSVAVAIRDADRPNEVLIVQRPAHDDELPDVWGLPAGSLREGESWEDAVLRAGRDKLGVVLEPGPVLESGAAEREAYTIEMRLYQARILEGEPTVPQPDSTVTQYQTWRWGRGADLRHAMSRGSLCSMLYLRALP